MQLSAINCSTIGHSKIMLIKLETKRKKKNQALIVPAGYFVLEEQSMFVK